MGVSKKNYHSCYDGVNAEVQEGHSLLLLQYLNVEVQLPSGVVISTRRMLHDIGT